MNAAASQRIVHVPRRFVAQEWGGTETVILELARQQQRRGACPEVFTSMALAGRAAEEIGGVPVRRFRHCYPFLGLSAADRQALDKKGGNLLSLSLFRSLLLRRNVRLFHAHALKRLGGEVRTAARLRRKPFVVSLHGGVFDVPAAEREELVRPIANKPEWGKAFGALFGSRRLLQDADQVICVGRNEYERAAAALPHDRVAYLPNGVDCARFAQGDGADFRRRHGLPADAFVVLNLSRIDAQKNQLLLLEAFVRLLPLRPDAHLVLVGPETQPEYASRLRAFIVANGLGERVRFLPGLRNDHPDLVNAYQACDVFVLPSMHEPFGIVVLEAWSAGKPVVVNCVGGLQSLVDHGRTGLFIQPGRPGSATDLAAQLHLLAARPAWRAELGAAGRAEVRRSYDWDRIAGRLEELYQRAERHAARRYGRPAA